MNVLLLIFIVINTVKAEECWIPGVCLGELMNQLETESPLECLEEAKKHNAKWFSVDSIAQIFWSLLSNFFWLGKVD